MSDESLLMLTIVFTCAALAPLIVDHLDRIIAVPSIVIEIALGIIIGPSLLDWVDPNEVVDAFSDLGLALLMFLAGYELDFARIKGGPLRAAWWGWAASLTVAILVGVLVAGEESGIVIALALTTTALGTVLPILSDRGLADTQFGSRFLAVGAVGEFAPIILIAFALSGERPAHTTIVLIAFAAVAVVGAMLARRPRHPRVARLMSSTLLTGAQFGVRLAVVVVLAMFTFAQWLGLDPVLGAFTAGIVVHLALAAGDPDEARVVLSRLHGIGFGFLIPIFFVSSGVAFDLDALLDDPAALALVPVFLVLLLVIRGVPTFVLNREPLGSRQAASLGQLAATGLPLIVVITAVATEEGVLTSATAAALVGAGMLSVLIFPSVALNVLTRSPEAGPLRDSDSKGDDERL